MHQLEDSDVLKLNKLIQICESIDRGYDIHLERTRKSHYPSSGIIEARLAWKRKLLKAIARVFDLNEVIEQQK